MSGQSHLPHTYTPDLPLVPGTSPCTLYPVFSILEFLWLGTIQYHCRYVAYLTCRVLRFFSSDFPYKTECLASLFRVALTEEKPNPQRTGRRPSLSGARFVSSSSETTTRLTTRPPSFLPTRPTLWRLPTLTRMPSHGSRTSKSP